MLPSTLMGASSDPAEIREHLADVGAVLIRGPMDQERFEALSESFGGSFLVHQSKHRDAASTDGTTQTVTRGQRAVELHKERSYTPGAPDLLFFHCVTPAADGGETTLCDGAELLAALPAEARARADATRIVWTQRMPKIQWRAMFAGLDWTAIRAEVRAIDGVAPGERLEPEIDGDDLVVRYETPCVGRARDGRPVIANYALLSLSPGQEKQVQPSVPGGGPFPRDLYEALRDAARRLEVGVPWQAGDTLVVDNTRVMHGRRAFDDPRRKILVRMSRLAA